MAEEKNTTPLFAVRAQYVKDLSFENPHAPQSLLGTGKAPTIDVGVDLGAQAVQEGIYEVSLRLSARAHTDDNSLFLVELLYAGVFQIANFPEDRIETMLLIEAPFLLFPFARRIISDATRDGGFPPLLLDPIDFHQLYIQNKQKKSGETKEG